EGTIYTAKYSLSGWEGTGSIPIGKPLSNIEVYILDKCAQVQPVGVAGEMYVGGAGGARGYLNRPELTTEKFYRSYRSYRSNILYKTGDLARWLSDGNIEFLGRIDYQVKVRGFRVEPGEIENRLLKHPRIKEAIVLVQEEKSGDKYLCAYVVSDGEYGISELREYLSLELPDYMIPSYFVPLDKIPQTPSGKVDRRALPKPGLNAGGNYTAPRNKIEKKLVELWAGILGRDEWHTSQLQTSLGIDDNFFQLGGHSLKATILVSKIHRELEVKVELMEIFRTPTIRHIARLIRGLKKETFQDIEPVEKKEYYPLSSAQKRLYFLQQLDLNNTGYNMPRVLPLGKGINKDKLESTLNQLIARHESLRTSFEMVNGEVVQMVHEHVEFAIEYYEQERRVEDFIRSFDLARAPLMRSRLIVHPDGDCTWMLDIHHIVSDGTSQTILTEDFMQLVGTGVPLEPLPIQYKDFAQWQNQLLASGLIKDQEDYWLQLYPGEIPRLNLVADYERPGVFTFEGDHYLFKLERGDTSKFKVLGARYGGTLCMNMLAALNTLFYKYTGQTDIIIGSGIAGRRHVDIQAVVGMFVNTLAMRNYPFGEKSYENFLKEVIANSVRGFENQDVQFEELVEKLDPARDPSRNPLFDILMVVQNFREVGPTISMEQLRPVDEHSPAVQYKYKNPTSKFDLTFFVYEQGDEVFINIEYYTAIFKPDTIRRLVSHFKQVVKAVIEEPGIKLQDIDVISEEEKLRVLYEFNDTDRDYPRDKTLPGLFEEQVEKAPDCIALSGEPVGLVGQVGPVRPVSLTYGQLNEHSNRLANYLYHENRGAPGQLVGIMMDRSLEMITALLGILKAGGAYVPISPSYPLERIKNMINDAGIKILLSQKRYIKTLNRLQWECGTNLETFLCIDSQDVYGEEEAEENQLMSRKLWEYVGETAVDEVTGGGWNSSYTGEPIPKEEMDEYGDNILKKLEPLFHPKMRVLEIGVASGISMYRIAPRVGLYYGTDLSAVIIEKNNRRVKEEGHKNIKLLCAAAHEIDRLDKLGEKDFDLIIINSVIQCFHGHNYLRKVIRKAIDRVANRGYLFIGDIMDQDLKEELIADLVKFKKDDRGKRFKTKTDWPEELFVSRSFWQDLALDYPEIHDMEFSGKIHTIENELTKFRYDGLFYIDKGNGEKKKSSIRHKNQHDLKIMSAHDTGGLKVEVEPGNLAYIIYTSGSTGIAKGTLTTHYNVTRVVKNTNYIDFKRGDRVLQLSDYAFDGSIFDIFGALLNGLPLIMVSREDMLEIETLCRLIKRERITVFFVTTALFNTIVEVGLESLSGIRKVLFGGERVSVSHAARALNYLGKDTLVHVYGPTETTVYATYYAIREIAENQITIPIGAPISNTNIYILDLGSRLTPIGVNGEIYIGGSGVCRGYLNNPELTAEKFKFNRSYRPYKTYILYKTGDLGRWLPDGNIEFNGRIDQQVKVRGYRIELGEIEKRMLSYPGIKECVVTAREDEKGSRYLCAYPVVEEKIEMVELKDYLAQVLPDYMIPGYFVPINAFPLKSTGKVDHAKLPDPRYALAGDFVAPRDGVEKKMMEIWSEVLGIGQEMIGIDANFFELGGHSLKATVLVSRIHKEMNVKVPLAEVFKRQTIRELSEYIGEGEEIVFAGINPVEKKEYYALSSAQERLYFLQQFDLNGAAYNIPSILPLGKEIEKNKLEPALKQLIARHESLRTSFVTVNEEVFQKIQQPGTVAFSLDYYEVDTLEVMKIINNFIKPFDLSKAPLIRSGIIKLPDGHYIWMVDVHHIVSDGTSHTILTEDFMSLYRGMELAPLRLQYKDFAHW
ncbi:MAG TPA: condensation domain-containing protein, partial [Candidatus Deferrimicrobium sp.]|nr:condensation domain-containing protein [Candidatus Deferrimicrobium sp.]